MLKMIVQCLFIAVMVFYSSVNAQKIIFLNGTTSSGKSSIAKKLKKLLKNKEYDIEIITIDEYVISKIMWLVGGSYCNPFKWGQSYDELITSEKMRSIINESQKDLCNATTSAYHKGKIVIVDTVMIEQEHIQSYTESFKDLNISWILVYCPLNKLVDRIIQRNKSSDEKNQRSMVDTLNQFSLMYNQNTPHQIDKLGYEKFLTTCDKAQRAHTESQDTITDRVKSIQNAACAFSFNTVQETMKINFGLINNQETTIGPVEQYNLIVNTDNNDISTCASMIMEQLKL